MKLRLTLFAGLGWICLGMARAQVVPRITPLPLPGQPQPAAQTAATNQLIIEREQQRQRNQQAALRELREDLAPAREEEARQRFKLENQARYAAALAELERALQGPRAPAAKRAVFLVENTFLNGALTYADFDGRLRALAGLCRRVAADSLRPSAAARFLALHRLMTDTLRLPTPTGQLIHYPPRYDFEDYRGEDDHTRQFVHRLLLTNGGQCHSMPLLYKLLADELGIRAYLSMAPSHSYIQVQDNRGTLYSYETTNGHFVSDAYYMASGYIKAAALKHRAYLDTLTQRETVACSVFDLAHGYIFRYGYDDFVERCVQVGLRYYPHSVEGRMLAHDAAFLRFRAAWQAAGRPTQAAARQLPALRPLLEEVERRTRAIEELGYEEMPPEQYQRWLKQVEEEKSRRASQQAATQFGQSKP